MPDTGSRTAALLCQSMSGRRLDWACWACRLLWTRTATVVGLSALVIAGSGGHGRPATDTSCVTQGSPYALAVDRRYRHG